MLLFAGISNHSETPEAKAQRLSVQNPKPAGLKGLYLVLKRWRLEVQRWVFPLSTLEGKEVGTIVFADPRKPLSPLEKLKIDDWMKRGGLVVLMKKDDWSIKEAVPSRKDDKNKSFYEAYGVEDVGDVPLLLPPFQGAGRLMVVPEILDNKTLQKNPEKSLALIQEIMKQGGPIYFDEYHLSVASNDHFMSAIGPFLKTKWGVAILYLSIVFLFALHFFRPPHEQENMTQPMENLSVKVLEGRGLFFQETQAKEFCRLAIENYSKYIDRRSLSGKRSIK